MLLSQKTWISTRSRMNTTLLRLQDSKLFLSGLKWWISIMYMDTMKILGLLMMHWIDTMWGFGYHASENSHLQWLELQTKREKLPLNLPQLLKLNLTRRKYSRLVLILAIQSKSGILCLKLIILWNLIVCKIYKNCISCSWKIIVL